MKGKPHSVVGAVVCREYMEEYNIRRKLEWDKELGEDIEHTKKAILSILKVQKVSLSKIRTLFDSILEDIEDKNPINY